MNNQAYSVPQFLDIFQLGRTKAYEEISSGRLVTYRVGRRRFISHRAADEWQRELEATNCLLERPTEPILADPAGAMKLAGGGVSTAYESECPGVAGQNAGQIADAFDSATGTRNSAESTLISALERALHVVHVGLGNDYTVCKYGYSYYAQDFAALKAFAVRLGVCHG
jgi:hypothetical protein